MSPRGKEGLPQRHRACAENGFDLADEPVIGVHADITAHRNEGFFSQGVPEAEIDGDISLVAEKNVFDLDEIVLGQAILVVPFFFPSVS